MGTQTTTNQFTTFGNTLGGIFDQLFMPLLVVAISLCAIYAVRLGLKVWNAEGDENKWKEAKNAILRFFIGIVVIFAVSVGAPILISALVEWRNQQPTTTYSAIEPIINFVFFELQVA